MIRSANAADLEALVVLEQNCFGGSAWSPDLVLAEISSPNRTVLVDIEAGALVAYGSVGVAGDIADLYRIAVDPAHRRAARASALLERLLAAASKRNASKMLLEVRTDNRPALSLYEVHGFKAIARRREYYADKVDAVIMEYVL